MQHIWSVAVLLLATAAPAAPQFLDGRTSAMGGAGVAAAHYGRAGIANPALLTRFGESDTFSFTVPSFGIAVADEDDLIQGIDDLQDEITRVQALINNATVQVSDLTGLLNQLNALQGRALTLSFGGGLSVASPSKTLGWSFFVNNYSDAQAFTEISPLDTNTILNAVVSGDLNNLSSNARVIGVAITDIGVSIAHEFSLLGLPLSIGISPKLQRVDVYNYAIDVNNYDLEDFRDSQFRDDNIFVNFDVGVTLEPIPSVVLGAMARNMIEHDVDTVTTLGQQFTYHIEPTLTIGAAFATDWLTVTAEVDVTEFERFKLNDDVQMVRAGAEFNLARWVQVRGGFQHDLSDNVTNLFTAGLGISPFDLFHLDIAGMTDLDKSYGAVIQTTFTF